MAQMPIGSTEKMSKEMMQERFKDIELQLSSGILFEGHVFTKVPIKGQYTLTYKIGYGRVQSKWSETMKKDLNKSRSTTFEYNFGQQKQEVR
jgi:hypothetical protein